MKTFIATIILAAFIAAGPTAASAVPRSNPVITIGHVAGDDPDLYTLDPPQRGPDTLGDCAMLIR